MHRRQSGAKILSKADIVVGDDRHITRNLQPAVPQTLYGAEGHDIGLREYGGNAVPKAVRVVYHELVAELEGAVSGDDECLVDRKIMIAQSLAIPVGALAEGAFLSVDGEAENSLVSEAHEMVGGDCPAGDMVGEDVILRRELDMRGDCLHEHDRNALVVDKRHFVPRDVGVDDDQPVDLPAVEQVPNAVLPVCVIAELHDQIEIRGFERTPNLVYEQGEVQRVLVLIEGVRTNEADDAGASGDEAPGGRIEREVAALGNLPDTSLRLHGDETAVVEASRHGRGAHLGNSRYVTDRQPLLHTFAPTIL